MAKVFTTDGGRYTGPLPAPTHEEYVELSQAEAEKLAATANAKAEKLGIKTRYEVRD